MEGTSLIYTRRISHIENDVALSAVEQVATFEKTNRRERGIPFRTLRRSSHRRHRRRAHSSDVETRAHKSCRNRDCRARSRSPPLGTRRGGLRSHTPNHKAHVENIQRVHFRQMESSRGSTVCSLPLFMILTFVVFFFETIDATDAVDTIDATDATGVVLLQVLNTYVQGAIGGACCSRR